jgi:hypothetical protein
LEGGFGESDPIYMASRQILAAAPSFFSTTILGITNICDAEPEQEDIGDREYPLETPIEVLPVLSR